MIVAVILFAVGALFGLHILTNILRNKPTPKPSVIIHGLLVAIGLILVLGGVIVGGDRRLMISLILFIVAALGGFTMLFIDVFKKKLPPKILALLHPVIAAVGLIILIIYLAGK